MALSAEPRLGLFVVARLAARHDISVSLRESAYGGTRAIVLVRAELLGDVPEGPGESTGRHDLPVEGGPALTSPTTNLPIPVAELPPLPLVETRPGEDLFRPQRPVDEPARGAQATGTNGHANGHGNGQHATNGTRANGSRGAHSSGPHRTGPPGRGPAAPSGPHAPGAHARPEPPTLTVPPLPAPLPRSAGQPAGERPALPQRRRQQNLAPQLRDEPASAWPDETDHEEAPDRTRSRLAAYQRGTRQGREEPAPDSGFDGGFVTAAASTPTVLTATTTGSVGNGQHRSE